MALITDERSSSSKTRLAVNSHSTRGGFADFEEPLQNRVGRSRAVDEEEVLVLEAGVGEPLAIVDLLVQPHHAGDVVQPEVGEVGLWGVQRVTVLDLAMRVWAAEGEEFLGHKPVEVAVLHFLVVFILIVVKVVKVEET